MLKNLEKVLPSTTKITDQFKFIPFVSPTADSNEIVCKKKNSPSDNLSGEEASQFYKEVVSSPPDNPFRLSDKKKETPKTVNKIKTSFPDNSKFSIFHHAQSGNIEGIKFFLSKHYDVNIQDMYGWTPLMCATFEGHYNVVEYLLKCGANINVKNKQGLTAFDIALTKNNKVLVDIFKYGVINNDPNVNNEIVQEQESVKYCTLCECSYVESSTVHERSIAHLFSSRDNNISTYYHIPENNKGFQIMLKKGWDKNKGLGLDANGRKFPIKTVLKTDRSCIGSKKEVPKITHFGPNDHRSVKSIQPTLNLKRERSLRKSDIRRLERRNRQLEIEFRRQFYHDESY